MSLTKHNNNNAGNSLFDTEKTWLQRDFGLDRRLIKALSKLNYVYPTLIQSKCIPIALQGKDVLVRARTGSGKTVAFALPVLQKVLQMKTTNASSTDDDETDASIKAILLAPTKELVKQIEKNVQDLMYYCKDAITTCSLLEENQKVIDYRLQSKPDILISTPARLAQLLKYYHGQSTSSSNTKNKSSSALLDLQHCTTLVIDEADLILSYGYKQDVNTIVSHLPKIIQGILMSATLSAELDKFKRIILHNPAILKLEEDGNNGDGTMTSGGNNSNLLQFYLESTEQDKFLILYVFIKLGLLQGKGLIFVNDVNKCYRLKLFLQQFFISSAVLNCEVPVNSRSHILEEFNRGVFDYLIATDATVDHGDEDDDSEEEDEEEGDEIEEEGEEEDEENQEEGEEDNEDDEDKEEDDEEEDHDSEEEGDGDEDDDEDIEEPEAYNSEEDKDENEEEEDGDEGDSDEEGDKKKKKKDTKKSKKDDKKKQSKKQEKLTEKDDYGVSRGIDFTGVNFVINFDFPQTTAAYTHRIGRTARGVNNGTALSFVTRVDATNYNATEAETARRDREVLDDVRHKQPRLGVIEGDNVLAAIGATNGIENDDDESRMQPAPLVFNRQELESFRYRVMDTLRSVTGAAVREFRTAEIRREVLNSEKLKSYFAENPNDLKVLRHDKAILHPIRQKDHLKFVPDYLIPATMKAVANVNGKKKKRKNDRQSQESRMKKSKMNDPLYGGNNNNNSGNGESSNAGNIDNKEKSLYGKSSSGRQEWKEKHKKGEFNPKMKKRNSVMTPGTFQKYKSKFKR